MLALKRSIGQQVVLRFPEGSGIEPITIGVVDACDRYARIGIQAQAGVEIIREELLADWRGRESGESAK
jgi:sRNA-binding carbon storage regulator CsrA